MQHDQLIKDNCKVVECLQNLLALEQRDEAGKNEKFSCRILTPSSALKPKDPKGK